jgi:two-component system, OmpR family, sensor histidine kinase BaeS
MGCKCAEMLKSPASRPTHLPAGVELGLMRTGHPLSMTRSITAKLFLAVLATAAFAVLAMGFAAHWSFERGFLGYVNEQAAVRMDAVLPRVVEAYRQHGTWDYFRGRPDEWRQLVRPVRRAEIAPVGPGGASSPPMSDLTGAVIRLTLLDEQGAVVVGFPQIGPEALRRPVVVEGRTVGWLAQVPFQTVSAQGDVRFQRSQARASWMIGAVCMGMAAVIAWWAARFLLRPMQRVAQATHALAAGDYSQRVEPAGHDEVGQLARDFNRMAETLERNERARREFMADISHELRTPLAILHGELEAMQDGVRTPGPAGLASLQAEVATMTRLVNDLHEVSLAQVGAHSYRLFELDLVGVAQTAIEGFRPRAEERPLTVQAHWPAEALPVLGDEARLRQLLGNLLENALRYTDPGGTVRLTLSREGRQARLDLMDSAPGVPPSDLPRLFERFYRQDRSRNRATGGSGLGLAICRAIAEGHQGSIQAQASPWGGVWITVLLPLGD